MPESPWKIKSLAQNPYFEDVLVVLIVILVGLSSFGLGRLSLGGGPKEPIVLETPEGQRMVVTPENGNKFASEPLHTMTASVGEANQNSGGAYVASKNGKRYYPVDCAAANRIASANRIWFQSREEAESKGFTPAANCP